jgi:hypothetical protein
LKCCLDEDLSPTIAEILRARGIDAKNAHEVDARGISDVANAGRPHHGVLIVPYSLPADRFARIARAIESHARPHPDGLDACTVDFLGPPRRGA